LTKPRVSGDGAWAIVVTVAYSVLLAAGGGYVFYSSIRPVSIPAGYFAFFGDFPWIAANLVLDGVWLVGSLALLILGSVDLYQFARLRWWSVVAWACALAANMAIGVVILHDFGLLFDAFPKDLDGSPLGPSRFAPGGPYWQALIAAGGQLAVGALMIVLIAALPRKAVPMDDIVDGISDSSLK
jgi:hypothetical protein